MIVISVISTKGGVGKTTITANLGGFLADAGLRVLMIDLDIQPTLSSYYKLRSIALCGIYELIATNELSLSKLISKTTIDNLDLIFSNDDKGQLNTLLLHAPDGRFRLKNLLPIFEQHYDVILIDTQGARSITLEMAIIASNRLISPVTPKTLAAREFRRGTVQLLDDMSSYRHLGIELPGIEMLLNRVPTVSNNAKLIQSMLNNLFKDQSGINLLNSIFPALEAAYESAAIKALPVHRIEYKKPMGRKSPAAIDTIRDLAIELLPQWKSQFLTVTGKNEGVRYVS